MFRLIFWWFLASVILVVLMLLFVSNNWIEQVTANEQQAAINQFGEAKALPLIRQAHEKFVSMFVETGIEKNSFELFIPQHDEKHIEGMGSGLFGFIYGRLASLWAAIYQGVIRAYFFTVWVPYFAPFAIALLIDAIVVRKLRIQNFEFTSPIHLGLAFNVFIFGIFAIIFYFLAPFSISYTLVPFWGLIMLGLMHLMIINLQRTR